jgi:hypothetical protein
MFGSGILEVAIGVIFVFLLVSLLCSAVREGIESWTKTRAAYLEYGIRGLLHDENGSGLARSFFNHPLIYGLYAERYQPGRSDRRPGLLALGKNLPSYIPARNFAVALMDLAARGPQTDVVSSDPRASILSLESVRANVLHLENVAVQRVLLTAIDAAQGDFDRAQANLEAWYDSGMERVAGWYKRSTQWIIFWIALASVIGGNINTITIATELYRNDAVRAAIVERAGVAVADPKNLEGGYVQIQAELSGLQLPIGWGARSSPEGSKPPDGGNARSSADLPNVLQRFFVPVLGWLLTALAATLGAPFWFDVLKKVMVIRGTVKPSSEGIEPLPARASSRAVMRRVGRRAENGGAVAAAPSPRVAGRDAASGIDSCESRLNGHHEETPDDQLPVATGGVA